MYWGDKSRENADIPCFISLCDSTLVESWWVSTDVGASSLLREPLALGEGWEGVRLAVESAVNQSGEKYLQVSPSFCKEALAEIYGAWRGPLPKASDKETKECKYVKSVTGPGG